MGVSVDPYHRWDEELVMVGVTKMIWCCRYCNWEEMGAPVVAELVAQVAW